LRTTIIGELNEPTTPPPKIQWSMTVWINKKGIMQELVQGPLSARTLMYLHNTPPRKLHPNLSMIHPFYYIFMAGVQCRMKRDFKSRVPDPVLKSLLRD